MKNLCQYSNIPKNIPKNLRKLPLFIVAHERKYSSDIRNYPERNVKVAAGIYISCKGCNPTSLLDSIPSLATVRTEALGKRDTGIRSSVVAKEERSIHVPLSPLKDRCVSKEHSRFRPRRPDLSINRPDRRRATVHDRESRAIRSERVYLASRERGRD